MRFNVEFLGCKVSHADAHALRERLLADGHTEAVPGVSELTVINSCCVTAEAVAKTRKIAARAVRAGREVYVTGCAANLPDNPLGSLAGRVTIVSGPPERASEIVAGDVGALACVQADARLDRIRAFVKIQDGCSFGCGFCVIPLVRGASRSRSAAAVLTEVRRRIGQGHREVVLTGINLGCFRDREAGLGLPGLVRALGEIAGLDRLRLSSIEINHVDDELIAALRETPNVAKHLHVPLQSGDDGVLKAMRRRYSAATYLRRLAGLGPEFNLTTDVIVGFPSEDEQAFGNTLRLIEEAGITRVHTFPYSPRPGTETAESDTVSAAEKRERGARLRLLSQELEQRRWRAKLGAEDVVLVDRPGRGYGDDYSPFLVDAPVGGFVRVRAEAVTEEGILAVAA